MSRGFRPINLEAAAVLAATSRLWFIKTQNLTKKE